MGGESRHDADRLSQCDMSEQERLESFRRLEEELVAALAAGNATVTLELPTLQWLELVQEIKNRHPRNMSRLIRDNLFEELGAVVSRLDAHAQRLASIGSADYSR